MNKKELLRMAFTNLFRRKARSLLAILGVLIGCASIITMVSIGLGMSKSFSDQMAKNPELHIIDIFGTANNKNVGAPKFKMDDKAIKYLKSIDGITTVSQVKNKTIRFIIENYVTDTSIIALDPEFLEKSNISISDGRTLKKSDKFKFIIGKQTPMQFENYKTGQYVPYSPTGDYKMKLLSKKVELTNDEKYKESKSNKTYKRRLNTSDSDAKVNYEVFRGETVGVIDSEGQEGYSIFTTLETLDAIEKSNALAEKNAGQKQNNKNDEFNTIKIYIQDVNRVSEISTRLKEDGFSFYSVMDDVKEEQKKFAMIQAALGGIGAISLFVAALGITNTMIMSIYERTREIGVMKVIGASLKDIEQLFLFEAASIGLIGGVIGSILSLIISYVINFVYNKFGGNMMNMSMMYMSYGQEQVKSYLSYIPPYLVIFGILFSTMIGVVAGYIPARKAMSLSALESLRND